MRLLEYEAKGLLKASDIPIPQSFIVTGTHPDFLPAVIKSQVPVGGRGKAGGIAIVESAAEFKKATARLSKLRIKGFAANTLLAEELLDIQAEYYLSFVIDRQKGDVRLLAHTCGGVEVEENETGFLQINLGGKNINSIGRQLAVFFDISTKTKELQTFVSSLYDCMVKNDALLLEINPLVITKSGKIVAGDCKMKLDTAAKFRHPNWDFYTKETDANFVTLDTHGNVATIANGAGLAMATVDAVASAGLQPANFLDIGGGASEASVLAAFKRIMEYPNIKVIVINVFAGITRCDEIARAIIAAKSQIPNLPPLSIRLTGTNFELAAELLREASIPTLTTLEDCIDHAKGYSK